MLPVTLAGVKLLCGIGDTAQDAGVSAVIALEQAALEYALDPAILTNTANDAGLLATLVLGVTECLAGAYLATQGRDPASPPQQTAFRLATLAVSVRPLTLPTQTGPALAATGLARLAPFSRSARSLARTAAGGDQLLDDQAPVPLLLGSGLGQPGPVFSTLGPPVDSTFDAVLGTDGHTEPPGLDDLSPGLFPTGWGGE